MLDQYEVDAQRRVAGCHRERRSSSAIRIDAVSSAGWPRLFRRQHSVDDDVGHLRKISYAVIVHHRYGSKLQVRAKNSAFDLCAVVTGKRSVRAALGASCPLGPLSRSETCDN